MEGDTGDISVLLLNYERESPLCTVEDAAIDCTTIKRDISPRLEYILHDLSSEPLHAVSSLGNGVIEGRLAASAISHFPAEASRGAFLPYSEKMADFHGNEAILLSTKGGLSPLIPRNLFESFSGDLSLSFSRATKGPSSFSNTDYSSESYQFRSFSSSEIYSNVFTDFWETHGDSPFSPLLCDEHDCLVSPMDSPSSCDMFVSHTPSLASSSIDETSFTGVLKPQNTSDSPTLLPGERAVDGVDYLFNACTEQNKCVNDQWVQSTALCTSTLDSVTSSASSTQLASKLSPTLFLSPPNISLLSTENLLESVPPSPPFSMPISTGITEEVSASTATVCVVPSSSPSLKMKDISFTTGLKKKRGVRGKRISPLLEKVDKTINTSVAIPRGCLTTHKDSNSLPISPTRTPQSPCKKLQKTLFTGVPKRDEENPSSTVTVGADSAGSSVSTHDESDSGGESLEPRVHTTLSRENPLSTGWNPLIPASSPSKSSSSILCSTDVFSVGTSSSLTPRNRTMRKLGNITAGVAQDRQMEPASEKPKDVPPRLPPMHNPRSRRQKKKSDKVAHPPTLLSKTSSMGIAEAMAVDSEGKSSSSNGTEASSTVSSLSWGASFSSKDEPLLTTLDSRKRTARPSGKKESSTETAARSAIGRALRNRKVRVDDVSAKIEDEGSAQASSSNRLKSMAENVSTTVALASSKREGDVALSFACPSPPECFEALSNDCIVSASPAIIEMGAVVSMVSPSKRVATRRAISAAHPRRRSRKKCLSDTPLASEIVFSEAYSGAACASASSG